MFFIRVLDFIHFQRYKGKHALIVMATLAAAALILGEKLLLAYSKRDAILAKLVEVYEILRPTIEEHYLSLLIIGLLSTTIVVWNILQFSAHLGPGPKGHFVVGNYFSLVTSAADELRLLEMLKEWRTRFGDFYRISSLGQTFVVLAHADDVNHVLSNSDAFGSYGKGPMGLSQGWRPFGLGIINSDGIVWQHQRRAMVDMLHTTSVSAYVSSIGRHAKKAVQKILDAKPEKGDQAWAMDAQDLFGKMTYDALMEVICGEDGGALDGRALALLEALDTVPKMQYKKIWRGKFWWIWELLCSSRALSKAYRVIETEISKMVDGVLIDLQGDDTDEAISSDSTDLFAALTVRQLRLKRVRRSLAGSDMLARMAVRQTRLKMDVSGRDPKNSLKDFICNAMYCGRYIKPMITLFAKIYADSPKIQARVVHEILQSGVHLEGGCTMEKLSELRFLHSCLLETVRLYTPVSVHSTTALRDDKLPSGKAIKKGERVVFSAQLVHSDPEIWHNPDQFVPARFGADQGKYTTTNSFLAFHSGPRRCCGREMGIIVAKIFFVELVKAKLEMSLKPGHVIELDRDGVLSVKGGLPLHFMQNS